MENFEFTTTMVRTLKGAPLSCLMIMAMVKQPVTAQYLERTSGYSDKSVGSAVLLLEEYGWISRNGRYAWQIADGVKQLPLMTLSDEGETLPEVDDDPTPTKNKGSSLGDEIAGVCPQEASERRSGAGQESEASSNNDKLDTNGGTRRISDSEILRVPVSSSSRSLNPESREDLLLPIRCDESENFRVRLRDNLAACDRFGIREPKRSSLSALVHVTPRLIRYHCLTAQTIGLAIYRIEKNWQIKRGWIDPDKVGAGPDETPADVCAQTSDSHIQETSAEAIQAWEQAKIALQSHLKRADFVTWVESTSLISADMEQRIFRVHTGNQVGAEWLKEHAVQQLEAELGGKIEIEW